MRVMNEVIGVKGNLFDNFGGNRMIFMYRPSYGTGFGDDDMEEVKVDFGRRMTADRCKSSYEMNEIEPISNDSVNIEPPVTGRLSKPK